MSEPATASRHPGRLVAWLGFVLALTALNYAGRFAADDTAEEDIAYQWISSIGVVVQFGLMLGVLLLIAKGLPKRELFALRRPRSWKRAIGLAAACLVAIYLASLAYTGLLSLLGDFDPTEEQGLVPDGWDSSRAAPFVAFFLAVTLLAPIVEELTYRGLGFSLLAPYGVVLAIVVTGSLFGLTHGLLIGLPVLAFFGIVVGWLRAKTDSVYPGMLLHATFNAVALLVAVSGAG
ncbi:MAG: CPBP family glutamic-type intramembrane protease [Gaiellaceae bacterium]